MGNSAYGAGYNKGLRDGLAQSKIGKNKGGCLGIVIFFVSLISMLYKIL